MCIRDRNQTGEAEKVFGEKWDSMLYYLKADMEDINTMTSFSMLKLVITQIGIEGIPGIPVSYTHLDVYKRQIWRNQNARNLFLWTMDLSIGIAGKNWGIDVYKRQLLSLVLVRIL